MRRPKQIQNLALKFISSNLINETAGISRFMAVHWRFEGNFDGFGAKLQSICNSGDKTRCRRIKAIYENPDLIVKKIKKQMYSFSIENNWNIKV